MKDSLKTGFSFGLTSGIITTLGLIVGLNAGTHSKLVVIGGILTIAVADAFSDAMGIHISEEAENKHSTKEIWLATISAFLTKFFFALSFTVVFLFFELFTAVLIDLVWGLFLLSLFSYLLAREQKKNPRQVVAEHLIIALVVIIITNYVGDWIALAFR
jgi:VIT1/CCC1 family predicted Fe2+/Mn2+ transporter